MKKRGRDTAIMSPRVLYINKVVQVSITFVQNHALSANEELMLKSKSEATYVLSS